jgi:hypothetical protein
LLSTSAFAEKYDYKYHGLAIDAGGGLAIPLADNHWNDIADTSFKFHLQLGYEIPVHKLVLVAPEISLAIVPVNTDDHTFQDNRLDATFTRFRFLAGGRVGLRLGRVVPYLRLGLGVDYLSGSVSFTVLGFTQTQSYTSTAFVIEPAVGAYIEIIHYLVTGIQLGFPVAFHDVGNNRSLAGTQKFTAFDLEIIGFIGFRY